MPSFISLCFISYAMNSNRRVTVGYIWFVPVEMVQVNSSSTQSNSKKTYQGIKFLVGVANRWGHKNCTS